MLTNSSLSARRMNRRLLGIGSLQRSASAFVGSLLIDEGFDDGVTDWTDIFSLLVDDTFDS